MSERNEEEIMTKGRNMHFLFIVLILCIQIISTWPSKQTNCTDRNHYDTHYDPYYLGSHLTPVQIIIFIFIMSLGFFWFKNTTTHRDGVGRGM